MRTSYRKMMYDRSDERGMDRLRPARRIGRIWRERRKIDPNMRQVGQTFVRIMEYVAKNENENKK